MQTLEDKLKYIIGNLMFENVAMASQIDKLVQENAELRKAIEETALHAEQQKPKV